MDMSQWFYTKGEQRHGPVALEQLNLLAAAGALDASDLVWREGMSEWLPANTIEGLTVPRRMAGASSPQSAAVGTGEPAIVLLTDFKIPQTVMGVLGFATLMAMLFYVWENSFSLGALHIAEALSWVEAIAGVWLIIMALRIKGTFTPATAAYKSVGSLLLTVGILPPLFALLYHILGLSGRVSFLYAMLILPIGAYSLVKMREMQRAAR
jgi:hypothetical protein